MDFLVLDTETTGFRWYDRDNPFLIGTWSSREATPRVDWVKDGGLDWLYRVLQDDEIMKVGHTLKFDLHMIRRYSPHIQVRGPLVDVSTLAHLAGFQRTGLKEVAQTLLGVEDWEKPVKKWLHEEKLRRKKAERKEGKEGISFIEPNYSHIPEDIIIPYLLCDVEYTKRLFELLYPRFKAECPDQLEQEGRLIPVVMGMERVGCLVDTGYLAGASAEAVKRMEELDEKLKGRWGRKFNSNSHPQLEKALLSEGLKPVGETDKGQTRLDAVALASYHNEWADTVLEHRKLGKMNSTYYEGILELVGEDKRLHPSFRQNGCITGRFSCASPNLQNIPRSDKSVRRAFLCPPGKVLLYADYNQIEMRLFASYCGDEGLIASILSGEDLHLRTSRILFGDSDDPSCRQIAKTINFGVIYGMGPTKLAWSMGELLLREGHKYRKYSTAEAKGILDRYYAAYPAVKPFMERVSQQARRAGFVSDIFGKRYRVPVEEAYKATNYLIQGTAAQVMKRGLLRVAVRWPSGEGVRAINCVHDELQLEVAVQCNLCAVAEQLVKAMEERKLFKVPLTLEVSYSTSSWADKKPLTTSVGNATI